MWPLIDDAILLFPPEYHDIYLKRLREGKDGSLEGQILSVADKIDLLYESFGEIQKRNPEPLFFEIYEMSLLTIRKFSHLTCVQDFLENILTDMLKERFIPKTELMDITESIMNKEI